MVDNATKIISVFPDVKILVHGLVSLSIYLFWPMTVMVIITVDTCNPYDMMGVSIITVR